MKIKSGHEHIGNKILCKHIRQFLHKNNVQLGSLTFQGDVARDDWQRRFLAQHSVAMLEQCCNPSKQCRNNAATLCCAKNPRCESSRLTSPLVVQNSVEVVQNNGKGKTKKCAARANLFFAN